MRGYSSGAFLAACCLLVPLVTRAEVTVERFNPEGTVKQVRQATARFSVGMVAIGDPRLPDPFDVTCSPSDAAPDRGRWVDAHEWVYDFAADLPAGVRCELSTVVGLVAADGTPVVARTFRFDTGGPAIVASLPNEGAIDLDEQGLFVLALDGRADPRSVSEHTHCEVKGIGERIPVDVLDGDRRRAALAAARELGYSYARLLWRDESTLYASKTPAAIEAAENALTVLECRRALPPDSEVRLVWGAGVTSASGIPAGADQTLTFRTRPELTARFECERVNAEAACLPAADMRIVFSAPVARAMAERVRLVAADASRTPKLEDTNTVDRVVFEGPFPERTAMRIEIPADLTDDGGRRLANAARFPLEVATDAAPPLAKFSGEFGILEAAEGGILPVALRALEPQVTARRLPASGARSGMPGAKRRIDDEGEIARWLERVRSTSAPRGEWLKDDDGTGRWVEHTGEDPLLAANDASEAFEVPTTPNGGAEVVGIPLGGPGFYVVELASPRLGAALLGIDRPRYVATTALVTNLAVHFLWGRDSSLVWVTTLDAGEPVAGADVRITDYCTGSLVWRGVADDDGTVRTGAGALPAPHEYAGCDEWHGSPLLVSARTADDLGFTLSSWNEGITPSRFGLTEGRWSGPYSVHTVFDRSLLRAGETVSMKHFVRTRTTTGFVVPTDLTGTKLTVTHDGSGQSYELPLGFDAAGIAESAWAIPADAKVGSYQLRIDAKRGKDDQTFWPGSFRLEEYRVPTMRAVIQPPDGPLVNVTSVPLDLFVGYLSGGGANGAAVKLRTVVEPRSVRHDDYEEFVFGADDVQEGVTEDPDPFFSGSAAAPPLRQPPRDTPLTLDDSGVLRTVVAELPAISTPHALVAELEFQDPNGETATVATRVPLWSAAVQVGIATEGWAASENELRFRVLVLGLDGKPAAGRDVEVELFARNVYSYRKRLVGGFYAYENQTDVKHLEPTCEGTSDERGLVLCEVEPGVSGAVILRARAEDDDGNVALATREMWLADEEDWWFGATEDDRMDVLPEQKRYEPGDTARLQVRMPFREATALITVEREGVLSSFVTELDGGQPVIEVPIDGAYAPNVFVSVLAVRGRVGSLATWIADIARSWELRWRFDGGSATGLVDLSKPAYRLGIARVDVGWRDHELAVAVKADKETYRVRDRARVSIAAKPRNNGVLPRNAEVAFAAVDEGLLELSPNDSWGLLDEMMERRGIEVLTSTAQMRVVGKRHYGKKAVPQGGGGGHEPARELFDTLLLWRGRVPLDASGTAEVDVPLVDSLTSYRLVAVASAGDGLFGTGQTTIRTTQDLVVTAGVPPLVREGDRYSAVFTVRNASDSPLVVEATGQVRYGTNDAVALNPESFALAPGKAKELSWVQTVPAGADDAVWEIDARTKDGSVVDRVRAKQRVLPTHPVRVQQATLTQLDGTERFDVARPSGSEPGRGGVELGVQARLADALAGVHEYMALYPYWCFEQRTSRAVALRDTEAWGALMRDLPAYLDRDGLLKYFPTDALSGDDTLTAYVVSLAHAAGLPIPDGERRGLLAALTGFVEGRIRRDSVLLTADLTIRKLAALAALSRWGPFDARLLGSIVIEPNLWPTSALLDWIEVVRRGDSLPNRLARRAEAERILRARMNVQGTTLGFSTESTDALPWLMVSPDLNAVRALAAFVDDPAWRTDLPRMARGAMGRRLRGHWSTTPANAWGVVAFDRFSAAFEKTAVTGATTGELAADVQSVDWSADARAAMTWPWPDTPATLAVTHRGGGRPWITLTSRAALPLAAPLFTGFSLEREITPVTRARADVWSKGDVARVRLSIVAQTDATWVVVEDAVPSGATLLGSGLGRDSAVLDGATATGGVAYPTFIERRFDVYRAYYAYVPKGRLELEYTLRFNNEGEFTLPPTRVEAMYAPEMFGELPVAPIDVLAPP